MSDSPIQLQGTLLLAEPTLRDGIFNHAVILLADHSSEEGALGVILNHPTGHEVGDFLKDKHFAPLARIPVHLGGPVAREQLTFSAFWWEDDSGLHWQLRLPAEKAVELTKQPGTVVRAFVGYSGWSAGQLESELRRQTWITARPARDLLGRDHDVRLWNRILAGLSPYHRILAEAPPRSRGQLTFPLISPWAHPNPRGRSSKGGELSRTADGRRLTQIPGESFL